MTALGAVVAVQVRHLLPFNPIKPELTGYDWPVEVRRYVWCGLVETSGRASRERRQQG